jgi:hypothetical protein
MSLFPYMGYAAYLAGRHKPISNIELGKYMGGITKSPMTKVGTRLKDGMSIRDGGAGVNANYLSHAMSSIIPVSLIVLKKLCCLRNKIRHLLHVFPTRHLTPLLSVDGRMISNTKSPR